MKQIIIACISAALLGGVAWYVLSTQEEQAQPVTTETNIEVIDNQVSEVQEGESDSVQGDIQTSQNQESEDSQDTEVVLPAEVSDVREEEIVEDVNEEVTKDLVYKNGTYTVDSDYTVPNGIVHDMDMTFVIKNDIVTDVTVVFDGQTDGGSTDNQARFIRAMEPLVIGKPVDSISLSRVGGASLTTNTFNEALESVKNQAS